MSDTKLRIFMNCFQNVDIDISTNGRAYIMPDGVVHVDLKFTDSIDVNVYNATSDISALLHELGHQNDFFSYDTNSNLIYYQSKLFSKIDNLRNAIEDDMIDFINSDILDNSGEERINKLNGFTTAQKNAIEKYFFDYSDAMSSVSDILDGLTNHELQLPYAHPDSDYWLQPLMLEGEFVAHAHEAYFGAKIREDVYSYVFRNSYDLFTTKLEDDKSWGKRQ